MQQFDQHLFSEIIQAFSGVDRGISREAKLLGNTALDAALNAQFLVQIGVFTAVPMVVGFILERGLLKVFPSSIFSSLNRFLPHIFLIAFFLYPAYSHFLSVLIPNLLYLT